MTKVQRLLEAASDLGSAVDVSKKGDYGACKLELICVAQDDKKVAEFYEDEDAQLYAYLRNHADDFIALIDAARQLRGSCDTGRRNSAGLQEGVRVPEKTAVIALADALKPFEE